MKIGAREFGPEKIGRESIIADSDIDAFIFVGETHDTGVRRRAGGHRVGLRFARCNRWDDPVNSNIAAGPLELAGQDGAGIVRKYYRFIRKLSTATLALTGQF